MKKSILFLIVFVAFLGSRCTQNNVEVSQESKDQALKIAQETQKALGKGLKGAIKKHDMLYAISFCKDTAVALTDHMGNTLNASIKRVSDKNRNPINTANEQELAYITESKNLLKKGSLISIIARH